MNSFRALPTLLAAGCLATGVLSILSCTSGSPSHPSAAATPGAAHSVDTSREERVARGLVAASPPAESGDAKARDAASVRLGHLTDLVDSTEDHILWGGFEAKKGYDPAAYRLTAFNPMVWAKLYLSTYMFPGPYEVRQEGRFTVVEVAAKFRQGLDPGDYPYPFWHSAQKWQAYIDTTAVLLVFERHRLVAAYRKAVHDPLQPAASRAWDGRWHWQNEKGEEQPRAALYSFILSAQNPYTANLEASYRKLAEKFRSQSCDSCHAPDNKHQADHLFLLNFPNQALAARHSLAAVLRGNKMPPPDPKNGEAGGIKDEAVRQELIQLAETFERNADAALAYESGKRTEQ